MGCDIHLYVEKKQPDGRWQAQGEFERERDEDGGWLSHVGRRLYTGRNYNLFAILANVRNGRGFAGIKTGEGFNPISEPRGVPDDASSDYKAIVEQWGEDGHSHSHHTLRQLLDFDWTQVTTCQGWCDMAEYLPWAARGHKREGPREYCGCVNGRGIKHLNEEEAAELVKQFNELNWDDRKAFIRQHPNKYALAVWQPTYYDAAGSFISDTIPELLKLAGGTAGLDDVRIVFFFDN